MLEQTIQVIFLPMLVSKSTVTVIHSQLFGLLSKCNQEKIDFNWILTRVHATKAKWWSKTDLWLKRNLAKDIQAYSIVYRKATN